MLLRLQSLALSCLAFSSLFISSAQLVAQSPPQAASRNADSSALTTPDIEQHVEGLLRQMTLAEQAMMLARRARFRSGRRNFDCSLDPVAKIALGEQLQPIEHRAAMDLAKVRGRE